MKQQSAYNKAGMSRRLSPVLEKKQILLALGVSFLLWSGCQHKDKTQLTEAPEIEVAQPQVRDTVIIYNSYPATLQSRSQADVVARANGQIVNRHFESGSFVRKGQVLFTLESSLYSSAVAEAKAQVASASGQLDYAEKHLSALEQALDANAVSEMDVIQARSARSQAQASVNQAKATLSTALTRMGYCTVIAPISGRITSSAYDVGAYISGEGSPVTLATIYDESALDVEFSVTDAIYTGISTSGKGFADPIYRSIPVYITDSDDLVEGAPLFHGDLYYQAPSVEASSGNIPMKARITDTSGELRPGMYTKVMLPVATVSNGILVNDASISTDQRGKYLYVVNDSNVVVYTPIQVGALYEDSLRLVTKGLNPTDRYVTKAMISVRNGEKIRPVLSGYMKNSKK